MENRIIKNLMADYLDDFAIREQEEATAFEHFCNYTVFTHNLSDAYSSDKFFYKKVHTGNGGDNAIDGIMIMVNDVVVTSKHQLEDVTRGRSFTVKFIFVQAKTSPNFESGDMLKVGVGVQDFFKKKAKDLNANENVAKYKELADYIFENSIRHKEPPVCLVYYLTTGKWVDDKKLTDIKQNCEKFIEDLQYFSEVKYIPIDAARLIAMYKEVKNSITREIVISKAIPFPPNIKGVDKAYLGLVQVGEYLKLITDEEGNLQNSLFYDNVRSYLGENPVNKEILETLKNKDKHIQFPILNNGVTIVAKTLKPSGDKYSLSDFQIVNGCQTSNVLYKCKDVVNVDMMLPIKIVCTEDSELINDVIRSTNRQTLVLDEAFESLKTFHKQLQDYYQTFDGTDKIFYERRTHEYDNVDKAVKKSNIVSLPLQLYAFTSMFLEEPHSVHRYYGELLRAYSSRVFQEDHKLIAYYVSALLLHMIENALRSKEIEPSKYREYRYHFLYMMQVYVCKLNRIEHLPRLNSGQMENLCKKIEIIASKKKSVGTLLRVFAHIVDEAKTDFAKENKIGQNKVSHLRDFTLLLKKKVENASVLYDQKR